MSLQCFFHRLLHDRLHLIRYIVSGFDNYLVVLGVNNTCVYPLQPTRNEAVGKFETIGAICLDGKIE
jgi:hypothetical protein